MSISVSAALWVVAGHAGAFLSRFVFFCATMAAYKGRIYCSGFEIVQECKQAFGQDVNIEKSTKLELVTVLYTSVYCNI